MFPTLILPGLNGSPEGHWQRHWAIERKDAFVVEQEDWHCPILEEWQAELDRALASVDGAFLENLLVGVATLKPQATLASL